MIIQGLCDAMGFAQMKYLLHDRTLIEFLMDLFTMVANLCRENKDKEMTYGEKRQSFREIVEIVGKQSSQIQYNSL